MLHLSGYVSGLLEVLETCDERKLVKLLKDLAPRARFELATLRLTAECSTIELPGIREGRIKGYSKKSNDPNR